MYRVSKNEVFYLEYLTMICDIKNSEQLQNREAVQYQLIDTLKNANKLFSSNIMSPFIITLGDEWQGLLEFPCDYLSILNFFHERMPEIGFYCGIGVGEVSVHNFELTVNQLDGPSFHKARRAIRFAKRFNDSLVYIQ
jgi:hypothetical protein